MKTLYIMVLACSLTLFASACKDDISEPHPQPVGGTCASIGGEPCECPDGTKRCSDHQGRCVCAEGLISPDGEVLDDSVPTVDEEPPKPKGVGCESMGRTTCECDDGTTHCSDADDKCRCPQDVKPPKP